MSPNVAELMEQLRILAMDGDAIHLRRGPAAATL
jgi:hypothetical protein